MTDESSDRTPSRRGVLQGLVGLGALGLTGLSATTADTEVSDSALQQSGINAQHGLTYNDGFGYAESDGDIVKFDVESGEIVNSFDSPSNWARGLAYGAGSLWFADAIESSYDGEILELDPDTGAVRSRISTSYDPTGLAFGEGSLWVFDITANEIIEYSTEGNIQSSFDTPGTTWGRGLAYFDGTLWLGTYDTNALHVFSTDGTREMITEERETGYGGLATTDTELLGPAPDGTVTVLRTLRDEDGSDNTEISAQHGLAYNDGFGYAESDGEIVKFDVESGEIVDSFDSPSNWARGLAYGAGSLWFADAIESSYDGEILELDPDTGAVRSRISTSYDPTGLAFGAGSLWVFDITANDIIEYSTEGDVQSSFDTPETTWGRGLAYFDGTLWLGTYDTNALHKFSADGTRETIVGERESGYGGLATTDTELLGPAPDGSVTVLRTLREDDGDDDDDNNADGEITACLGPTEVPLDGTADVCITLQDFSSGFSGCELVFEFPGAVSPESVTTNDIFGLDSTDISGQTVTISVTDTDNAFSGTIDSLQIGCVTVRGAFEDTGTVTLESAQVDNEDGFQIGTVDFSGSCRELSVVPGAQCPTVDGTETTDPDGDGLCEDLNGNDRKDFDDVVDLFDNISDSDVTDNPEAFDFNGNDRVDFDDVVDLFDEVS